MSTQTDWELAYRKVVAERDALVAEVATLEAGLAHSNEHIDALVAERDRYRTALRKISRTSANDVAHAPWDLPRFARQTLKVPQKETKGRGRHMADGDVQRFLLINGRQHIPPALRLEGRTLWFDQAEGEGT